METDLKREDIEKVNQVDNISQTVYVYSGNGWRVVLTCRKVNK